MTEALLFLGGQLSLVLFGAPAAFHPEIRHMPVPARLSAAFAFGGVVLSITATILSIYRVPWNGGTLLVAAAAVGIPLAGRWRAQPAQPAPEAFSPPRFVAVPALLLITVSLAALVTLLVSGRAVSPDWAYFWGSKAIRFAGAQGFDVAFLTWPYAIHTHVNYPPLYAVMLAWSAIVASGMPWALAPVNTALWILAAVPLVLELLRRRMSDGAALAATALWTVAIATTLWSSNSGGIAEAPLLLYSTLACAALMSGGGEKPSLFLAGAGLTGCVLTKQEGWVLALSLTAGAVLADVLRRRGVRRARLLLAPAAAVSLWYAFELLYGISMTDPGRPGGGSAIHWDYLYYIFRMEFLSLNGNTWWIPWAVPVVLLLLSVRRWGRILPALAGVAGMWLFLCVLYLQAETVPINLVAWTFLRVMQSPLSFLILGSAVAMSDTVISDER